MGRALVLGLGISGKSAASFLLEKGYEVVGFDDAAKDLAIPGMTLCRSLEEIDWKGISLMVASPGVSPQHPVYRKSIELGIEVIGEAELALRYLSCKAVGITGTNGKTTVTLLTEHVLKAAGFHARAVGNVGHPLTSSLKDPEMDVAVIELSSYQLETLSCRVFDAAVLINITPDHLERHGSMEAYTRVKFHLADLLKPKAPFFVSPRVAEQFGSWVKPEHIIYPMDAQIVERILPLQYRQLGEHDVENGMAAWSVCHQLGVSEETFYKACATFKKPRHRIEFVSKFNEVSFFNDSKGTNVDAVICAVRSMKGQVILIAGGVDKGGSYLPWKDLFLGKVKQIIAIGQAASKIDRELNPFFKVEMVSTLDDAVQKAFESAVQGDIVLLSPGCASYDMFRDYAHRGEEFERIVAQLYTHFTQNELYTSFQED